MKNQADEFVLDRSLMPIRRGPLDYHVQVLFDLRTKTAIRIAANRASKTISDYTRGLVEAYAGEYDPIFALAYEQLSEKSDEEVEKIREQFLGR